MIRVNMDKARDITRDRVREERKPLLEALDVEYMRALESQDTVALQIVSFKKQALRDATRDPEIDQASTPDELKAVRPAALDL